MIVMSPLAPRPPPALPKPDAVFVRNVEPLTVAVPVTQAAPPRLAPFHVTRLLAKDVPVMVAVPIALTAPPIRLAVLLVMLEFEMSSRPVAATAPPCEPAVLLKIVAS